MMDTKYRESLPNIIKHLPSAALSDDDGASVVAAVTKKARKSKKVSVGKNGLQHGEEIDITKWWISRNASSVGCDTVDGHEEATHAAILEQRVRETQLQIILILETLALEDSAQKITNGPVSQANLPEMSGDSQQKSDKPKKRQDLDTLFDLLADRLSIWQSTSVDEPKTSNVQNRPSSEHGAKASAEAVRNDCLRQFCVDIILPL